MARNGDNPNVSLSSILGAGGFDATGGGGVPAPASPPAFHGHPAFQGPPGFPAPPPHQAPSTLHHSGTGIYMTSIYGPTVVTFPKPGTFNFNMKCKGCGRTGSTPLIMPGGGPQFDQYQQQLHGPPMAMASGSGTQRKTRAGPKSKKQQPQQP